MGRDSLQSIFVPRICAFLGFLFFCFLPSPILAQTLSQFTNTTSGAIVDSPSCASTVTRSFSVGTSFTVSDINIGVSLSHSYRSDLGITLTAPSGTSVQLLNGIGGAADNLSVLFDDEASALIASHTTDDSTASVPPYARTFRPAAALSAFDGQNAQGTWTLVICDSVNSDVGTFARADLYITSVPNTYSDLALRFFFTNLNPSSGSNFTYALTLTNNVSPSAIANGVSVRAPLPAGVTFVSATGAGSYNSTTGIWTVGSLSFNSSAEINITVTVNASAGTAIAASAEIIASSNPDNDSIPDNGSTQEDDDAFMYFVASSGRTAGTAPTLNCPAGSTLFDWDTVSWTSGSTNNSYAVANLGTINFNMSLSTGASYSASSSFNGLSPSLQTNITAGTVPAQSSLILFMDNANRDATVTTTINLPTAVPGAQFRLFDVDSNPGNAPALGTDFADRVTIIGLFNGVSVNPILTNGLSNYVIGNSAYSDTTALNETANGDVIVTFSSPVDTIIIVYGNHSISRLDPFQQAITIHDINFCRPQANITATKTRIILSDGLSASNPKALPEAVVNYCILVSNAGSGTATAVSIADAIPATLTYVANTLASGPNCTVSKMAEDDDAVGADESDPFGASISGNIINASAATMGPNATFAITFNATIK